MEKISIVIPAWKEKNIERHMRWITNARGVELIMALADGDDVTPAPDSIKVTRTCKGRASQMNAGASLATGDIVLFLHADTSITPESLNKVRDAMNRPGVAGGAYRLKIDSDSLWLKLVAAAANIRSRVLCLPYGDQALFLRRKTFQMIGGYENIPIMEDVRLVSAIKKSGSLTLIDDFAVTSAHAWRKRGMVMNTARNWAIMLAYLLGATPEKLAEWFKR